ncbi:MAG: hypothetical protein FJ403_17275 [Verrucomicrobia bacterium]|nr:hypothetical protein [Verrucomicrobiota bacterium]
METNWAAEHLQVIRTLMERSAIYRRALAPIMLLLGVLGSASAGAALALNFQSVLGFGAYWLGVGVLGVSGAYLMVRRQALREAEPFWSPPTRRVTQAVLPPLFAGLVASLLIVFCPPGTVTQVRWLVPVWMALYGCALHAAGFFMPRGMKLFGWVFIVGGCAISALLALTDGLNELILGHVVMGISFGGLHLAYGIYLYFTEPRKNET